LPLDTTHHNPLHARSYTNFSFSVAQLLNAAGQSCDERSTCTVNVTSDGFFFAAVNVTNTGGMAGKAVVQVYVLLYVIDLIRRLATRNVCLAMMQTVCVCVWTGVCLATKFGIACWPRYFSQSLASRVRFAQMLLDFAKVEVSHCPPSRLLPITTQDHNQAHLVDNHTRKVWQPLPAVISVCLCVAFAQL
jgi:hypothetical protein